MNFLKKMEIAVAVILFLISLTAAKKTTTKTKLDIRVVRSPQHGYLHHPVDAHSAYVLTSQHQQARKEEEQLHSAGYMLAPHHQARKEEEQLQSGYVLTSQHAKKEEDHLTPQQVSLITEAQYEALLKQAQKALQGYDLTKLSAVAHQAAPVHTTAAPVPEHKIVKPVYKPAIKYVYTDVASYTAPVSATYSHTQTDEHENEQDYDHYSKHKFGYRVSDPHTGAAFGHSEVSEGHVTRGHYHVLLPDGRLQNVKYVADPSGYHATVTYDTYKH